MKRGLFVSIMVVALLAFGGVASTPEASGDPSPLWDTSPTSGSTIWPGVTVTVSGGSCYGMVAAHLRYYNGLFGLEEPYPVPVAADGTWSHSRVVPPAWVDPIGYVLVDVWCGDVYAAPNVRYWYVTAPPASPSITVGTQGGSTITVEGANFPGETDVVIEIESVRTTLGTVTTSEAGTFSATYDVPCAVGNGPHTVIATATAAAASAIAAITVSGCPPPVEVAGSAVRAAEPGTAAAALKATPRLSG